jgi:hypothetical protein
MNDAPYVTQEDVYRVVPAEGGVTIELPGGFATTALDHSYPDAAAAHAAIAKAIAGGLPALAIVDGTQEQ